MSATVSLPARNRSIFFVSLAALALSAAALTGAALGGAPGGAVQKALRTAGFGGSSDILAEQRRHAQSLERIELAIDRVRTDVALLKVRIETEIVNRSPDVANATPVNRPAGNSHGPDQGVLPEIGPAFDLRALRPSFDTDSMTRRAARTSRQSPHRASKAVVRPESIRAPNRCCRHTSTLAASAFS